jgi:class 3 adenylate cyclase
MRPVTVLFADVVGSTGLGERLSPDEVKALIGECVSRMSLAVEEFGGTIQAYMGDGICAYFGVPAAHEDDPERAARAGLRILEVVGEYARDVGEAWGISDFNVRVGINSGQTAVGQVGAGAPQTVALGDTTNVAARLQSSAEPGTIAVGEKAASRLGQRFVLEPVGEVKVKGRDEAVPVSRLVAPLQAPPAVRRRPMVGRDQELSRLVAVVDELRAGRGQVLLISGEAGLGKTRLLAELREMAGEEVTWLEGPCVSYQREFLSRPFIEMLRALLGVAEDDPELLVRTKLRAKLAALFGDRADEVLPYLARVLSVKLDPVQEQATASLLPEELAGRFRAAYVQLVDRLASDRPVVVALRDMHWAYSSSRELAEDLLRLTDRAPLLMVATFRPDPSSEAWSFRLRTLSEYSHRTVELPLHPLSDDASGELLETMLPPGLLSRELKQEIVSRAEGNPLYVEELLQAVLSSGSGERKRTWTLGGDPAQLLPAALEGLFVARIDRLPAGPRRVAQAASVIGRTFSVALLERLHESEDLQADLAALLRADVVREVRRYPQLECTFKHGLLQEAALSTLTPTRLRELYGRLGEAAEALYGDAPQDHLEQLAFYFYRSDAKEKALRYLERAAEQAEGRALQPQALELWTRAQKVARALEDPDAEQRASERIHAIGTV